MAFRQSLIMRWVDTDGGTRAQALNTVTNPAPSFGSAGGLISALQAASVAGLLYAKLDPIAVYSEAPAAGPYPLVTDYASLQFRTAAGTSVKLNVPAPLAALFNADNETVNLSAALVVAIKDAMVAAFGDANGNAVTTLVSGRRCKLTIPQAFGA